MNSQAELIYIFGKEKIEESMFSFQNILLKLQENIPPSKLQRFFEISIPKYLENLDKEEVCAELLGISLSEFKTRSENDGEKLLKDCILVVVPKIAEMILSEFEGVLTKEEAETFSVASIVIGMQQ